MSYDIVKSLVNGQVIDQHDQVDGVSAAVKIENDAVFETGVTDFTGYVKFVAIPYASGELDDSETSSCIIPFHINDKVLQIGTTTEGSSDFSLTKDTGSKINIYVESGELKIQNKTGADISINLRF